MFPFARTIPALSALSSVSVSDTLPVSLNTTIMFDAPSGESINLMLPVAASKQKCDLNFKSVKISSNLLLISFALRCPSSSSAILSSSLCVRLLLPFKASILPTVPFSESLTIFSSRVSMTDEILTLPALV